MSEKVTLLSAATTPAEAQAALTAPASAKPQPKTFAHAIARAALASSQALHQQHAGPGEDPLATALEKYALASERVGEARLAQDAAVQARFLAGWNTTLNTNIAFATRARKNVEKARLTLDAAKARAKGGPLGGWKLPGSPKPGDGGASGHGDDDISPEMQEEIEKAEDEFVTQTEEAVGVMKDVSLILLPFSPCVAQELHLLTMLLLAVPATTGPRHARASPESGRAHRRPDGVPQEGI